MRAELLGGDLSWGLFVELEKDFESSFLGAPKDEVSDWGWKEDFFMV